MERLQQDSTISLEQHQQQVLGAIAETVEKATAPAPQGHSPVAKAESPPAKQNSIFINTVSKGSLFLGGGVGKAAHARASLVPMGYAEKKEAARKDQRALAGKPAKDGDLFARAQIAGQSLTGTTSSGKKNVPMKGAALTMEMAQALGVGWLLDELSTTNRALQNPYENAPKRLRDDLEKGKVSAELYVRKNTGSAPALT